MDKTSTEVDALLVGIEFEPVLVGIVMGSESDREVMAAAGRELDERRIRYEIEVMSAHRDPDKVAHYARTAQARGLKVLIAGAGHPAGDVLRTQCSEQQALRDSDPRPRAEQPRLCRHPQHRQGKRPRHRVRGGGLPEHRRVLGQEARHLHDHG